MSVYGKMIYKFFIYQNNFRKKLTKWKNLCLGSYILPLLLLSQNGMFNNKSDENMNKKKKLN